MLELKGRANVLFVVDLYKFIRSVQVRFSSCSDSLPK